MYGSLYLLNINVLILKSWEKASELPEKDWMFHEQCLDNQWIHVRN